LNHNPKNKHNHIKANGKVFHSDIEALAYVTALVQRSGSVNKPTMDDKRQSLTDYLARKGFLEFCMTGSGSGRRLEYRARTNVPATLRQHVSNNRAGV